MSRRRRRVPKMPHLAHAGMNLVPLVDMALNLVLILLIMAPAMYMVRLPVRLPEAQATRSDTNDWVRVSVAEDERVSVDGDIIPNWNDLPKAVDGALKLSKSKALLLEVDRHVPYRTTARLLSLVKALPAERIAFSATQMINANTNVNSH